MFTDAPIGVMPQRAPAARRRSQETWAAAREAYLGGQSGPEVAEQFDVGLSALRQRAAGEGWRRTDQADPAPRALPAAVPPEALDEDEPLDAAGMAELSLKRARRAMLEGKVREVQSWTKVHQSWRRLAAEDADQARRAAEVAETADETFARRSARRDYNDRLRDLLRADDAARASAEGGAAGRGDAGDLNEAHDLHEVHAAPTVASDAQDVHDLHDLYAQSANERAPKPLDPRRRRALARLEALKARRAARDGP